MQIAENRAVALVYTLTVDKGIVVDSSSIEQPLWYIHGRGSLLPSFEHNLQLLQKGDAKIFTLSAEEGYGPIEAGMILDVPKAKIERGNIAPGETVSIRGPGGQILRGQIEEIGKTTARINFNHPLAGKALTFNVQVADVRLATSEELIHGHVHTAFDEHHHGQKQNQEDHLHGPNCHH